MISEDEIQKAVDWLRDNAHDSAQARANRIAMEEGRKRLKAVIMKEHVGEPVSAQEREAYADPRYEVHLEGLRQAVYEDEKCRMLRAAAEAKIDVWRSFEATHRAVGRVG